MEVGEVRRISPEKAFALLQEKGLNLSMEQVKAILDFLYKLANTAVAQYLKK